MRMGVCVCVCIFGRRVCVVVVADNGFFCGVALDGWMICARSAG